MLATHGAGLECDMLRGITGLASENHFGAPAGHAYEANLLMTRIAGYHFEPPGQELYGFVSRPTEPYSFRRNGFV